MKQNNVSASAIQQLIQKRGWIDIVSSGTSMYPIIQEGDICRFIPIAPDKQLNKRDIVLFINDQGHLIGHRYFKHFTQNGVVYYFCKGDTNINPDLPVPENQVIGKLVWIKKKHSRIHTNRLSYRIYTLVMLLLPSLPLYLKQYIHANPKHSTWSQDQNHA